MLVAGGCSSGSISCVDIKTGACSAYFARFLTDTSITVSSEAGASFTYSSEPQAALLERLVEAITALAARIPPAPEEPD